MDKSEVPRFYAWPAVFITK